MASVDYAIFDIGTAKTFSTNGTSTATFNRGYTVKAYDATTKAYGTFKFVRSKVVIRKGSPVGYSSPGIVSHVKSAGMSAKPAGVACAKISASCYGWIQTKGFNFYRVRTDTGISAGDTVMKDNDGDNEHLETVARTLYGTQIGWTMGNAIAADSSSYMAPGTVFLACPD